MMTIALHSLYWKFRTETEYVSHHAIYNFNEFPYENDKFSWASYYYMDEYDKCNSLNIKIR